jgi:hypothetical protein
MVLNNTLATGNLPSYRFEDIIGETILSMPPRHYNKANKILILSFTMNSSLLGSLVVYQNNNTQ